MTTRSRPASLRAKAVAPRRAQRRAVITDPCAVLRAKVRHADDVFATQLRSDAGAIDAQLAVFV